MSSKKKERRWKKRKWNDEYSSESTKSEYIEKRKEEKVEWKRKACKYLKRME